MNTSSPNYMFEASEKPSFDLFEVPLIVATEETVKGYGCLVDDPDDFEIEIIRWPSAGWRPIDKGTGGQQPRPCRTDLSGIGKNRPKRSINSRVNIAVIKDDDRGFSTKFQRQTGHIRRCGLRDTNACSN